MIVQFPSVACFCIVHTINKQFLYMDSYKPELSAIDNGGLNNDAVLW